MALVLLTAEHARVSRTAGSDRMRRILFLARAEVLHVVRDRATLAQVLVAAGPSAARSRRMPRRSRSRNTPTYVVDFDRSSLSRGWSTRFRASGHFRVDEQSESPELADEALAARRRDDGADDSARLRDVDRARRAPRRSSSRSTRRKDRPPGSCRHTRRASPPTYAAGAGPTSRGASAAVRRRRPPRGAADRSCG